MSIRLAPGELCPPPLPDNPRSYLGDPRRFAWIEVVKAIARDQALDERVLGSLADNVFPIYRSAVQESPRLTGSPLILPDELENLPRWCDGLEVVDRFVQAILDWSQHWYLPSYGFQWIALQTLWRWSQEPALVRRHWCVHGPTEAQPYHGAQPVSFSVSAWHPQTETRAEARCRMMLALEALVDRHLEDTEIAFRTPGIIFNAAALPTPIKQGPDHFDWFVCFQVKGEPFSQIGREASIHRTAVQRAVDAVGQILDSDRWRTWRRQRARGGRPRSSSPR
jgi:hypothetical protein